MGDQGREVSFHVATRLVRNEVISFAFYLFSSLVAKSLKTHLFTYLIPPADNIHGWWSMVLRGSLFALSTSTSIIGYVLLLYSMIDMIQLRFGKVTCEGVETLNAVGVLIGVNIFALLIYVLFVGHAIVKSTTIFENLCPRCPTCHHLIRDNPVFSPTCQHTSQNP
ncbi:hypothetical protein EUGRSUZ_A00228 [Eucalyptus grandis]|uniref:Uncharacterized protein n=2 Tax=Eucalyptus grandis TaxID=71139 RepID=A0ACC3LY32_EUCGR|nr:hypothetical protein EUGRSUZ_A00228 [Eucalyptus grandis]